MVNSVPSLLLKNCNEAGTKWGIVNFLSSTQLHGLHNQITHETIKSEKTTLGVGLHMFSLSCLILWDDNRLLSTQYEDASWFKTQITSQFQVYFCYRLGVNQIFYMIQDLSLCFIVKFDCFIFKYLKTLAVLKPKLKICTV